MSFHVEPSERLKCLIDAHVGPAPEERLRCGEKPTEDHPYIAWIIRKHNALAEPVLEAVAGRATEIDDKEGSYDGRVDLGEVPLEVLGHACLWIEASCSPILGSYLGTVILAEERPSNVVAFTQKLA